MYRDDSGPYFCVLVATRSTKRKTKKKSIDVEEPSTNATPLSDPNLSQHQSTMKPGDQPSPVDVMDTPKPSPSSERILEEALDAAVTNASVGGTSATPPPVKVPETTDSDWKQREGQSSLTGAGTVRADEGKREEKGDKPKEVESDEAKPRSSRLRLVLNPLPSEDDLMEGDDRTRRDGCCDRCRDCARGRGSSSDSAESTLGDHCSSSDKGSSCKEGQLPLPSNPGI